MLLTTYRVASDAAVTADKWIVATFFVLIVIGFMASILLRVIEYGYEVLDNHKEDDDVSVLQEVQQTTKDRKIS